MEYILIAVLGGLAFFQAFALLAMLSLYKRADRRAAEWMRIAKEFERVAGTNLATANEAIATLRETRVMQTV